MLMYALKCIDHDSCDINIFKVATLCGGEEGVSKNEYSLYAHDHIAMESQKL